MRAQRRRERGAAIEQLARACFVDAQAVDAARVQHAHRLTEDAGCVQRVPGDDRHHHVQLELPRVGRGKHGRIAADHLVTNLIHHFGD
jgi:hypothetical protein